MRMLLVVIPLAIVAAVVYVLAGRAGGPVIGIDRPARFVGHASTLDVTIDAPGALVTQLDVVLEQAGRRHVLFSSAGSPPDAVRREGENRLHLIQPFGKQTLPELQPGPARLVVQASRAVLMGARTLTSTAAADLEVRLDPPRLAVQSLHHFINQGGSELIVYRVTPPTATSGVRVGDLRYPGYSASDAGVGSDPSLKLAFFALLFDQDTRTPIELYATDEAGNEAKATFAYKVIPKRYRQSRIQLDDRFLERVVPAIRAQTPSLKAPSTDTLLAQFLEINRDLRVRNNQQIASLAAKSASRILWEGPFEQLTNSAVESSFADQRTYVYQAQEVDRQVHLGMDLASLTNAPVEAAGKGVVIYGGDLGIYGNTIVLDHGLGVQSLYAHLSSFGVHVGDTVDKGQELGRSGTTGLAGGDHLHFTMLVQGHPVTPIDWWSRQWVQDRILRKLAEVGGAPTATATATPAAAAAR